MQRTATARRLATGAAAYGGSLGLAGAAFYALLREEARAARRKVEARTSKEDPPVGRRHLRSWPGRSRCVFAVLGDSSACGLGVGGHRPDPGRDARRGGRGVADRPVRPVARGRLGCESSDLSGQVERADRRAAGRRDDHDRRQRRDPPVRPAAAVRHLDQAVRRLRELGAEVVVGTCPDLGTVEPVPQPLRGSPAALAGTGRGADHRGRRGRRPYGVAGDVLGPEFASHREMFGPDRFHPSVAGYASAAAVLLPSCAAALGLWSAPSGTAPDPSRRGCRPIALAARAAEPDRHRGGRSPGRRPGPRPARAAGRCCGAAGPTDLPAPERRRRRPRRGAGGRGRRGAADVPPRSRTTASPNGRGPAPSWRTHARSSHRRHRPLADRPRLQGIAARTCAPTTWPPRSSGPRWTRCPSSTRPTSTT